MESWYKGDIKKVDWQHNFFPSDFATITGGIDYKEEEGSSYYRSGEYVSELGKKTVNNKGYYLQNQFNLRDTFFTIMGVRIDDYESFGFQDTYKVSGVYLVKPLGAEFKANWGTGFRSPSLYQLYSIYGDINLSPEKSESYDFGIKQNLWRNKLSLSLTYFQNDFKNLIDYDFTTSKYKNVGKAETKGIETEISFKLIKNLLMSANYTSLETEDKETGLELLRRPEKRANFSLDWDFNKKGNLNLAVIYVGDRLDYTPYPTRGSLEEYTKVDVSTAYDFTENFQIFGRVENIFDEEYEDVYGFNTPGVSFYGGVKIVF